MCNEVMRNNPIGFFFIPDHFKIQEMCIKAFEPDPWQLKYVPDWFMTQGQVKVWHDYREYCNEVWSKRCYNQRLLWTKTNN